MFSTAGTSKDLNAAEITQLFIDTAQKVEKCFGFEVAKWLERYQELRKQPNFPEAAMLIINAAQIYGRKVDYVEEIVYNIMRESECLKNAEKSNKRSGENEGETTTSKRKRVKRFRPETLCEKFHCVEFLPKEFKSLPPASLCEKIVRKVHRQGGLSFEDEFSGWTIRKDAKGAKKHPRRRLEIEEEDSHYTSFGESHIFDYDGEDIVGRRRDFTVFSGHIDAETQTIGNDINLRKYYRQGQVETTCNEANNLEDCTQSMLKPSTEELSTQVEESKEGGESVQIDSKEGGESMEVSEENHLQEVPKTPQSPDILLSDDEGIGMSQSTIQIGDLSQTDWRILSPNVELVDFMEHIKDGPSLEFDGKVSIKNLLGIDSAYLTHPEDFSLPLNLFERRSIVEYNILKLPEKKLRSRCLFALPSEWIAERRNAEKPPAPPSPPRRIFKLDLSLQSIPTPPSTPEPPDCEGFRGFDESEIVSTDLSFSAVLSSTVNPEKMSQISPQKHPRMSADSGIQSPPHSMDVMDSILEENTSQILSSTSDSGYGSILKSFIDGESPVRAIKDDMDVLCQSAEPVPMSVEVSEHQKNLQRIAAEKHQQSVDDMKRMTDKVNRWHEYLKPILRQSQSRGHFDIHAYGTEILNTVNPEKNPVASSSKITLGGFMEAKKDFTLLPRYFLSMLQLINTKNISISAKRDVNKVTNLHDIQIQFQSAERHHEEMNLELSLQMGDKRKRSPSNEEEMLPEKTMKKHRKGNSSK
uniref:Putative isoform a marinus n=1 Tax=Lutzomyia longipalpis TaxID=7200 RepID=A0A1B0GLI0_LUTLO